jgi:hypothetical protein
MRASRSSGLHARVRWCEGTTESSSSTLRGASGTRVGQRDAPRMEVEPVDLAGLDPHGFRARVVRRARFGETESRRDGESDVLGPLRRALRRSKRRARRAGRETSSDLESERNVRVGRSSSERVVHAACCAVGRGSARRWWRGAVTTPRRSGGRCNSCFRGSAGDRTGASSRWRRVRREPLLGKRHAGPVQAQECPTIAPGQARWRKIDDSSSRILLGVRRVADPAPSRLATSRRATSRRRVHLMSWHRRGLGPGPVASLACQPEEASPESCRPARTTRCWPAPLAWRERSHAQWSASPAT